MQIKWPAFSTLAAGQYPLRKEKNHVWKKKVLADKYCLWTDKARDRGREKVGWDKVRIRYTGIREIKDTKMNLILGESVKLTCKTEYYRAVGWCIELNTIFF